MEIIGVVAEYNPFHNGHLYQINKIRELYKDSIIVLVLNGYFLERGLISLESKEEKTKLALKYGVDIVVELPFVFGSNSADIFASSSIDILNYLGVNTLVFGSESNDIKMLSEAAKYQLSSEFEDDVKKYMDEGINYPTALNKANKIKIFEPNDLLGISYLKAIYKNNYNITPITIKRTNNFHDITSNDNIISATNIRNKILNKEDINKFIPEGKINNINYDLFFNILKYKIITDKDLNIYLTVDEGIHFLLKKVINDVNSLDELISKVKTKRYTYNRLMRMFIHIVIGLTKEDKKELNDIPYIRILGFNDNGQEYLKKIKKNINIPIVSKLSKIESKVKDYEFISANVYKLLTNDDVLLFEKNNKPIKK